MKKGISIIIPTYNGGQIFSKCLEMIRQQDYGGQVQLIIVDSGSTDGTTELAEKAGAVVRRIEKREFHHAGTRNAALPLAKCDKVIFMVQDAVPCSNIWLSDLEEALSENDVVAAYTDQIPHDDATPYARFEIESISRARGEEPVVQYFDSPESFKEMPYEEAYRAIGLDNVCAIYRKELLINTPFPEVDFAEDMAWALKNMLLGHKVMYNPRIKVKHSHNRSPEYAFNRQVINSFWCAKIMNRVENDMSFLSVRDLMVLTGRLERFVDRLRSNILGDSKQYDIDRKGSHQIIDEIRKKFSMRNRMKYLLIDQREKYVPTQSDKLEMIEQRVEDSIRDVLKLIENGYRIKDEGEWLEVLDQIVANILGRMYGEAFASSMLRDKISLQLDAFMIPFIRGV